MKRSIDKTKFRPLAAVSVLALGTGSILARNPVMAGSLTAFTVVFLFVFANAAWYQPKPHPAPFLVLRPAAEEPANDPIKQVGSVAETEAITQQAIIRDVQKNLRELGFYQGESDGVNGTMTSQAIRAYQDKAGLEASGRASDALLAHIRVTLLDPSGLEKKEPGPDLEVTLEEISGQELIRSIQAALKKDGAADLVVDGIAGQQTSVAIEEFQARNGLTVDGNPSPEFLAELRLRNLL